MMSYIIDIIRNWRARTAANYVYWLHALFIYLIPEDVLSDFSTIFWCNWRSLKPFLSRVILTHKDDDDDYGQIKVWERDPRAFLFF